jgi:ATP-binding cassette, subfamily B, bacterial
MPSTQGLAPLAALVPFMRPYWVTAVAALASLMAAGAVMLSLPYAARLVIDQGFDANDRGALDQHFLILFVLSALLALFGSLRYYLVTWMGERVVADLRNAVYSHVISLDLNFFEQRMSGEVLSRLTTDTTLVQASAGVNLSIILRSALMLIGGIVMLLFTSLKLTAVIIVVIPGVLLPLLIYGRRVRSLSRDTQDRVADTSGIASETLNAIQTVQAFTLESLQARRYAHAISAAFDAAERRIRARSALNAFAIMVVFGAVVFVLWLGAQDVMTGSMTPGELSQFLLYALMVAGSAASLSEMWGEVQRAAGAMERVVGLLQARAEIVAPALATVPSLPLHGDVRFDEVSFYYPTRPETAALNSCTVHAKPGQVVAIVGPSGAGKSTILQLLLRFYDPSAGKITIDGIDLRAMDPAQLRASIGIVPQDTALFAESALENIRYGRPQASDADVHAAALAADADGFIRALPRGYATALGERGARLSGGQRQRVAIARALLKDPPVLLLDEATSSLDAQSEQQVQLALNRLMRGRTTIVVAHRLSTVRRADQIVVISEGRAVEQGTHAALMKKQGVYAQLAQLQLLD